MPGRLPLQLVDENDLPIVNLNVVFLQRLETIVLLPLFGVERLLLNLIQVYFDVADVVQVATGGGLLHALVVDFVHLVDSGTLRLLLVVLAAVEL